MREDNSMSRNRRPLLLRVLLLLGVGVPGGVLHFCWPRQSLWGSEFPGARPASWHEDSVQRLTAHKDVSKVDFHSAMTLYAWALDRGDQPESCPAECL